MGVDVEDILLLREMRFCKGDNLLRNLPILMKPTEAISYIYMLLSAET